MKILLVAINSKYIHTSLAVRTLGAYSGFKEVSFVEYTINNHIDFIIKDIYEKKPEAVAFSCYIWNIDIILKVAEVLKTVKPDIKIILGGPEVSFDAFYVLSNYEYIDIVISGEGELSFKQFCEALIKNEGFLGIAGLSFRDADKNICLNNERTVMSLDDIPFCYTDIKELSGKILYYETQRGCPYNCQYCLSASDNKPRFMSTDKWKRELKIFIDNKVRQVKFVDRTFNSNKKHAKAIWQYIIDNDNGFTNFHMEITADILTEDEIELLSKARPGLFQLEIGVQTTNEDTIKAIKRKMNLNKLAPLVKKLITAGNMHIHLDLIAGLPFEGYSSFKESFNYVFSLKPHNLQLGFLKLLKGSGLRRDALKYGIAYNPLAPYEVLYTDFLDYDELLKLKGVEETLELYYNSGKMRQTCEYFINFFESPFDFFEKLSFFREKMDWHKLSLGKNELYESLFAFAAGLSLSDEEIAITKDILRFEMCLKENVKNMPEFLKLVYSEDIRKIRAGFYTDDEKSQKYLYGMFKDSKEAAKHTLIEYFEYSVFDYKNGGKLCHIPNYVLFNYKKTDAISGFADFKVLET
ncbi:MAG: B12-binding domain-containing radical SAM protein [Lachnospiraceae bacterium]|nr:B12-binding domain-containing radical SAM protein [Lachnospiraceae bacterium]